MFIQLTFLTFALSSG